MILLKIKWKEIVLAFCMSAVLPAIVFALMPGIPEHKEESPDTTAHPKEETKDQATEPPERDGLMISVLTSQGEIISMDMDDYLTGVVLMEMPAEFDIEALKAQAVVARTYALRRAQLEDKHSGAVCTDPACCQAYCEIADYLANRGTAAEVEKVRCAVTVTGDTVVTYDGELIEATYFSCSGGMTEDAQAVWGSDIPYLQSVSSPGEEGAVRYLDTVTYTASEFAAILGLSPSGYPETWVESVTYTDGGGVATMKLCGRTYKGTQLRTILKLRSTAFVLTAVGDSITITTKGYGHRVGMSQYGAEAMAVQGCTYQEILMHYYQGIRLESYKG